MKYNIKYIFLTFLFLISGFNISHSQVPGVNIFQTYDYSGGVFCLGWRFTTNIPLSITALGAFDNNMDGLVNSHEVGLWSDAGVLLASTTVPSGTAGTLNGFFRYVNISPIIIPAGTYRIANVSSGADGYAWYFTGSLATYPSYITFNDNRFAFSGSLTFPNSIDPNFSPPNFGFAGGNFLGGPTVPTLGEWGLINFALLAMSLITVFAVSRQKKLVMNNGMQMEVSEQFTFGSFMQDVRSNAKNYFIILAAILGISTLVFGIAVKFFQYEMTGADIPGSLIASLIVSLLVQFLLVNRNKH